MTTCVVEHVNDPAKTDECERFARHSMELVDPHGGIHQGYLLTGEGVTDRALALFSFPSFASHEEYREWFGSDPDFLAADRITDESS